MYSLILLEWSLLHYLNPYRFIKAINIQVNVTIVYTQISKLINMLTSNIEKVIAFMTQNRAQVRG